MAKLNAKQTEAINSEANVVVVIAGAGSGKTTVLTQRIEKLITQGACQAKEVLAITFTNKATSEMKERLALNMGHNINGAWIMTFHGFGVRVIRENLAYLPNHNHNFIIVDEDDKKKIMKDIIKNHGLKDEYKVPQVLNKISNAKTYSLSTEDTRHNIDYEYLDMYIEYEKYLNENNAFDFDDLLIYAHQLLTIPAVQERYQKRFKYIHVDEFQDTSQVQGEILKLLKSEENNLFVVGDVDQSIYGWRGATIDNIMNLDKNFKGVEMIKLEQNYRSSKNIIQAANSLIENNATRYDKTLWTENQKGEKIKAYRFHTAREEADFIQREVKYLEDFGKELSEIAILYRYNYQSKRVEEALMRARIPYVIYGGIRFYERMEIKDIIAYIRLIQNNDDNISFSRIINVPKRKVGDVTLAKIKNFAVDQQISYFAAAKELGGKLIQEFVKVIEYYSGRLDGNFGEELEGLIEDIAYYDYLAKSDEKDKVNDRMENIRELKEAIEEALEKGDTLENYLTELTLFSERENEDVNASVVLSTVHGVKGLEFDYVYLTGMNETKFPKALDDSDVAEMEEERRVAYVAITRARKKLVITNISYDFKNEYYEDSRFLMEMGIENTKEDISGFVF